MTEARAKHVERNSARRRQQPEGNGEQASRRAGDERWDELLAAAAEVFAEKGYRATSLQEIADRLGMLKGSLYYYINSKEELLYEVIRDVYRGSTQVLKAAVEQDGNGLEKVRRICEAHVTYQAENLTRATVLLHEMRMLSGERQAALMGQDRDYAHVVRGCVRQGQRDGSIRPDIDPHLTSLAVLGALNWVYRWYQPGGRYSAAQIGREYAELFAAALRASKPSGTRGSAASSRS